VEAAKPNLAEGLCKSRKCMGGGGSFRGSEAPASDGWGGCPTARGRLGFRALAALGPSWCKFCPASTGGVPCPRLAGVAGLAESALAPCLCCQRWRLCRSRMAAATHSSDPATPMQMPAMAPPPRSLFGDDFAGMAAGTPGLAYCLSVGTEVGLAGTSVLGDGAPGPADFLSVLGEDAPGPADFLSGGAAVGLAGTCVGAGAG
jgi:hypothetical protein